MLERVTLRVGLFSALRDLPILSYLHRLLTSTLKHFASLRGSRRVKILPSLLALKLHFILWILKDYT